MGLEKEFPPLRSVVVYLLKWLGLASLVAVLVGSASALFLVALDWATLTRIETPLLLAFLPIVGFCVSWLYLKFGQILEAGNNLLIDEIHDPKKGVPLRMAPLVLLGTVVSHLFGASVGREGTAVQMGGALADRYSGLSLPMMVEAFRQPLPLYDFAAKALFTMASLGSGFKGGEVTPLFCIGASLGNILAPLLNMPTALMAGVGFVAVFAGAANTPIASTLMAMELFGAPMGCYAGIACVVSYLVTPE